MKRILLVGAVSLALFISLSAPLTTEAFFSTALGHVNTEDTTLGDGLGDDSVAGKVLGASALTESQIQAILNLLISFGADSETIVNVNAALRGTPSPVPPPTGALTVANSSSVPAQNIAANVPNQPLGGFTVTNNTGLTVSVDGMTFVVTGSASSNLLTNVTVVDQNGGVVAGPVNAYISNGTQLVTFTDLVTFYTGAHTFTVRGKVPITAQNNTTIALATNPAGTWINPRDGAKGNPVSLASVASFTMNTMTVNGTNAPGLFVNTSPASDGYKLVAAGSQEVTIGVYRFQAVSETVRLQKLGLKLTSGVPGDLEKVSIYNGSFKVGEAFFVGNSTTATSTFFQHVSISSGLTTDLTLKANLAPIGIGSPVTQSGHLLKVDYLNGEGVGEQSGTVKLIGSGAGSTAVAGVRIYKSYPTVALDLLPSTGIEDGRLIRFKVTADAHGPIGLGNFRFTIAQIGVSLSNIGLYGYEDSNFSSPISGQGAGGQLGGSLPFGNTIGFAPLPVQVPAGQTRYFELRATASGVIPGASVVTTLLGDASFQPMSQRPLIPGNFLWSPNSTTTSRISDNDWTNGYGVPGLPSSGLTFARNHGGTTPPPSSGITVTAPNGGEQWEIGQLNTITWSPYQYNPDINPAKDVDVYLVDMNGYQVDGKVMDSGKASLHTYFNLGNYDNYAQPGQYYVRVTNRVTGATDKSNAPFTLLPRGVDIKVDGSDGPVSLTDNQLITVSIKTGTNFSSCTLNGIRANPGGNPSIFLGQAVAGGSSTSQGYAFAPAGGGYTAVTATCYKADGSARGDSVQVNIAGTQASVRVVSPNGGESYNRDQQMVVNFTSAGLTTYSLALYKNDTWKAWLIKDAQTHTTQALPGTFSFIPSGTLNGLGEADNAGAIWKIYLTGQKADGSGYVDDKSDAPFSFTASAPTPTTYGTYVGYLNGSVFITTQNISKAEALANCQQNANNNPSSAIRCTWNGEEIYNRAAAGPTCTLGITPSSITSGQPATLSWSSTNAASLTVNGTPLSPVGNSLKVIYPTTSSTYTGVFTGPGGTVTCTTSVAVTSATPPPNSAPSVPIVTVPTKAYPNTVYTISFRATDPDGDQVRFGIDDGYGSVHWWEPGSGYVGSGSTHSSNGWVWPSIGSRTYKVITEDSKGMRSAWGSFTVNVTTAPTGTGGGGGGGVLQ